MKVRLRVDLSKYHPSLKVGAVGELIGPYGRHSREMPQAWIGVRFPQHTLDVLRKQLETVMERQEDPQGPQLPIQSKTPPKRGQIVEYAGVRFRVLSIQERLEADVWLLNLTPE